MKQVLHAYARKRTTQLYKGFGELLSCEWLVRTYSPVMNNVKNKVKQASIDIGKWHVSFPKNRSLFSNQNGTATTVVVVAWGETVCYLLKGGVLGHPQFH